VPIPNDILIIDNKYRFINYSKETEA